MLRNTGNTNDIFNNSFDYLQPTFVHLRQKVCEQERYFGLSFFSLKVSKQTLQEVKSCVCSFNEVAIANSITD